MYSDSSAETRSRPGSCRCFWRGSLRKHDFSEVFWEVKVVVAWVNLAGVPHLECPHCSSRHLPAYHVWASRMKPAQKMMAMTCQISLAPFTRAAEAPPFPGSCPGKLNTYHNDAAGARRAWNSSLGLRVRPFCKSVGKPSKVTIFIFEG